LAIFFRHRGGVLILLAVPLVVASLRVSRIGSGNAVLGTSVALAGVVLRLSAVRRIGRGARTKRPHASSGLIAVGPFSWSRNPLYLAAGLMVCGFGLFAGAGWRAAALLPATLLLYTPVVLAEESALTKIFGDDYRSYAASVSRWIGIPRGRARECVGALVPWREVFRREKWLVPGYLAAVLAIAALRSAPFRVPQRFMGLDLAVPIGVAAAVAVAGQVVNVEIKHGRRCRGRRSVRARTPQSHPSPRCSAAEPRQVRPIRLR